MWLRNTSKYPTDEIRELVTFAVQGVDFRRVCVNVKGGRRPRGYAYDGVPDISNAPPSAAHLITLTIPDKFEPIVQTQKSKRWPPTYRCNTWQEWLVVVAAHEAAHIEQFQQGLRRSEVRAEHTARYALASYRGQRAREAEGQPELAIAT